MPNGKEPKRGFDVTEYQKQCWLFSERITKHPKDLSTLNGWLNTPNRPPELQLNTWYSGRTKQYALLHFLSMESSAKETPNKAVWITQQHLGEGGKHQVLVGIPIVQSDEQWQLDCKHPVAIRKNLKPHASPDQFNKNCEGHQRYLGECYGRRTRTSSYLQTPIIFGQELFDIINNETCNPRMPFRERLQLALQTQHEYREKLYKKNLVHFDIKPENILIDGNIPHFIDHDSVLNAGDEVTKTTFTASAIYVAPERIAAPSASACEIDIYSLILILLDILGINLINNKHSLNSALMKKGSCQDAISETQFSFSKTNPASLKKELNKYYKFSRNQSTKGHAKAGLPVSMKLVNKVPFDDNPTLSLVKGEQKLYQSHISKIIKQARSILGAPPHERAAKFDVFTQQLSSAYEAITGETFAPAAAIDHSSELPENISLAPVANKAKAPIAVQQTKVAAASIANSSNLPNKTSGLTACFASLFCCNPRTKQGKRRGEQMRLLG